VSKRRIIDEAEPLGTRPEVKNKAVVLSCEWPQSASDYLNQKSKTRDITQYGDAVNAGDINPNADQ